MSNKTIKIAGIILGIAAIVVAGILVYNLTVPGNTDNTGLQGGGEVNEMEFPQTIQGLTLTQVDSGPQAMAMISQLHGTSIAIKQGYIATYSGGQGQVTIWVSESNTAEEAKQLFDIMDKKIVDVQTPDGQTSGQQGPPFTDRRTFRENEVDMVAVKGMGMENYYYYIGTKVYWIAAGGVDPLQVLDEVMNSI